jgi:hypothetical protein
MIPAKSLYYINNLYRAYNKGHRLLESFVVRRYIEYLLNVKEPSPSVNEYEDRGLGLVTISLMLDLDVDLVTFLLKKNVKVGDVVNVRPTNTLLNTEGIGDTYDYALLQYILEEFMSNYRGNKLRTKKNRSYTYRVLVTVVDK